MRVLAVAIVLGGTLFAASPGPVEEPITAEQRDFWSFEPLSDPVLPAVQDGGWCRNSLDRFILRGLEERGLRPMPAADRRTLLRRVSLDLTGLFPTPEELERSLADHRPDAYERAVDRLLASPAYAERWAQHWLDLARYADTDGFEFDAERPNAWRYRDWVIEALDADMCYPDFVRMQIAGDLIAPDDPSSAIATGFLLCGPDMPDINLQQERRHNVLNEMTSTVGQVCLGLQVGCAACHDHKYDPLSQYDFYRLRAFFESCELFRDQELATPGERAAVAEFEQRRADRWQAIDRERRELAADGDEAHAERLKELEAERDALKKAQPPDVTLGRVIRRTVEPVAARLWLRGDFHRPGPEVRPAFPRIATSRDPDPADAESTPDREALANWLVAPSNALSARVIVNRLWQHHFGTGLCETPNDLGFMGGAPSHPELLDWLAIEFQRSGGSLKALHRLMVTSATYRTSSRPAPDAPQWSELMERDPANRRLGRMPRRRLDGETLRDSMLHMTGRLNLQRGGPGIRPPLPAEVVGTLLKDQWTVTPDPGQHARRSVYLFVRRNLRFPLFDVFDRPDANQSCPRRNESLTAPQALTQLNSQFTWDCAAGLAALATTDNPSDPVDAACRRVLGRPATEAEQRWAAQADDLTAFCAALFNASEFLYVD